MQRILQCYRLLVSVPIHLECVNSRKGRLETVKYLISEVGCNKEAADSEGLTPLHHAAM